jgi:small-conductance mechanosensitive channel
MVSFGATGVIGQAFNGFILMFSRAYRGDYVRIGEVKGRSSRSAHSVTRIRTGLGEEVTLPNSSRDGGGNPELFASGPRRRMRAGRQRHDRVLSAPWRQVHAMLEEAARRTTDLSAT